MLNRMAKQTILQTSWKNGQENRRENQPDERNNQWNQGYKDVCLGVILRQTD